MALKVQSGDASPDAEGGIVAEINITPLVDIFLVLLIIFMATSSVMSQMGVNVQLPTASKQTAEAQPDGVIVSLMPDGSVRVQDRPFGPDSLGEIEGALKELFTKTTSRLVVLEGDQKAFLGNAIQVMDLARKAGAERFAIATREGSAKAP